MSNESITIKNGTFLGDTREFCEQQKLEEIKKQKYLDPLYDAAFKAFLSDEQALVSFLNGVFHLEGDNKIKSVTVKNTEINIIFPQVKTFRLDIRAKTANGFCINVEMQKAKPLHFVERVLLQHSAFLLQSKYELDQETFAGQSTNLTDAERAERESRRYEIPPTFAIWICDFTIQQQDNYRGTWAIRNEKGLTISDKVKYIIYDLTQFNKPELQIKTDEERWLFLLKHAGSSQSLPDFGDETIAKAIRRILVNNASETLLREQVKSMVLTEEEQDYLAWIKMKGVELGADKKAREMARDMLLDNEPIDKIVKYTKLPDSEVLEIKASLDQK
ncbi:PD-(D/E)XK nuclease family transposase [Fibrobacter sp.]|jgi:predicted transposase/invertase (TIGR01784 family)|uniref:PD-(D/E)XK nuclease family transposase n=1 Tax=Fibrobacter sp. TaxID=35828 RepID=UPI00386A3BC5